MSKKVNFGVGIPTGTEGLMFPVPFAKSSDNIRISQEAERLGFDSVWGNDHVCTQHYVRKEFDSPPRYYSPLITLAAIGQVTKKIKLATALLVVPFRHPVMIAKEVATLDQLSGGRVLLGVGIGAYVEEFKSMFGSKVEGFKRGEMLDESLKALRLLWEERCVSFKGKYFEFKDVETYPKPVQNPLPIYIGGNSPAGRRRVAEFGNGWLPAVLSPDEIRSGIAEINRHAEEMGKELKDIDIAPQMAVCIGSTQEEAEKKFAESQLYKHFESLKKSTLKDQGSDYTKRNLIGTPEAICEKIEEYLQAGVTTFSALLFASNTVDGMLEMMQQFSEEVMPSFK